MDPNEEDCLRGQRADGVVSYGESLSLQHELGRAELQQTRNVYPPYTKLSTSSNSDSGFDGVYPLSSKRPNNAWMARRCSDRVVAGALVRT